MQYLLTCRSLTYAQRGARVLERAGITGTVSRAPKTISKNGCSYCILVAHRHGEKAVIVLAKAGLSPDRTYLRDENGSIREAGL